MKKEKNDADFSNLSLPDIIKRKTKHKTPFLDLEHDEQRGVLDFIKTHNIGIKVFGYKWYDVLSKKFFAIEYKPLEGTSFGVDKIELSFDSFEDFYNYVQGDIYQYACFYGFSFSDDQISNFNIKMSLLNFDSFVSETIDLYTFESLNTLKKEENDINVSRTKSMVKWFQNHEAPGSLKDLETAYKQFTKRFSFWDSKYIFFSIMLLFTKIFGLQFFKLFRKSTRLHNGLRCYF